MNVPMFDKILLHKAQVIESCISRARKEHRNAQGLFMTDLTRQDAAILNLQRACEAALDLAQRVISRQGWGIAEISKAFFAVLRTKGVIDATLAGTLINMVGFRNLAVHDYQELNMAIVESIILKDSSDLLTYSQQMVQQFFKTTST